jgi:hypothetical protein
MSERWWRKYFLPVSTLFRRKGPPQVEAARLAEPAGSPQLDAKMLQGLVESIFTTHEEELDCSGCFEQVDAFAEMVLAGKNAAEAMPLVQEHLDRCSDCRAEFEIFLDALRAIA